MSRYLLIVVFIGLAAEATASNEILYPGDVVTYHPRSATDPDSALNNTDGYVVRVVNSTYYDPPILVSWIFKNYSVSWKDPQDLVLKKRSEAASLEGQTLPCKQQTSPVEYTDLLADIVKIGVLFRSITSSSMFWKGDVCIYLGDDGLEFPLKRLWCFRSNKLLTISSFEYFQILGVSNYPGVYEYVDQNTITGFYRYPVVSKYNASISHKQTLKGVENGATLRLECSSDKPIDVTVFHSKTHDSNFTLIVEQTSVAWPITRRTTWTSKYPGANYLEFVIREDQKTFVKTGLWYEVLEAATHVIQVQAPGDDARFTEVNNPITITLTRDNISPFTAFLLANGSSGNESQYNFTNQSVHVINFTHEQRGVHEVLFSMVWNKLSLEFSETSLVFVHVFQIKNLTVTVARNIKTEADVKFLLQAPNGFGASCLVKYGDGSQETFQTTFTQHYDTFTNDTDIDKAIKTDPGLSISFTKNYTSPGVYHVNVTCKNEINSASYSTSTLAQDEITAFFVFNIPPHEFGQTISVNWNMERGTNVTVDIWYNDIQCNTSITFTDQGGSLDCLVDNIAYFDQDSRVDLKVQATNLVSNFTQVLEVEILEKFVLTSFVALTTTSQFGSGVGGAGLQGNMFPAEYPVLLQASYTGAPATFHFWRFHYDNWVQNCTNCGSRTQNSVFMNKEFNSTDNRCNVTLTVKTSVGVDQMSVTVAMEKSVQLDSVTMKRLVLVNTTETITINLESTGSHSCFAVDFNDNSSLLLYGDQPSCEQQYNVSSPDVKFSYRNETTTQIVIEHVFKHLGTFRVKITGKNYVSSDSFQQDVVVLWKMCYFPNVTITGFNDTSDRSLPELYKSQVLTLSTDNEIDCGLTQLTRTKWNVSKLGQDPRPKLSAINTVPRTEYQFPFETYLTSDELVLTSRSLEYGFYAVTARLEMDGYPDVYNEDTKYFYVVATPWLEPAITTGFIYTVIFRETGILNASATVDPDFKGLDNVTFQWFCRDMNDTKQFGPDFNNEPLLYVPVVNDSFLPAEPDSSGCFGEGRGRLNVTDVVLKMETTYMVEGKYYMITLVASKVHPEFGLRRSATEIYFQVIMGLPPALQTHCLKNCQEKVNPDEKLIVESTCVARCYGELDFKWTLFWFNHSNMPEPFDLTTLNNVSSEELRNMVSNPIDELQLAFKPNTLVPGRKYVLQLIATRPNQVYGELRHTLLMNEAPKEGMCSIDPQSGVAMRTIFNITCTNWTDADAPIKYDYAYEINGVRTIFFSGAGRLGETIVSNSELPIGESNRDNELNIFVNIKDKFEGTTEVHFTVKVEPPSEKDVSLSHLNNLLSSGDNPLDAMIGGGDPQKALLMAGVLASVLNHMDSNDSSSGNITAEEMARRQDHSRQVDEMKQTIMTSLNVLNVTNMGTLLQLSGTTQALTDNPGNLSPETQNIGVMLCNKSVEGLTKLSEGQSSFKNVKSAVTNLAGTLGQLISAASEEPGQGNLTVNNASVGRAQSSIAMLNKLHEATLRYMVTNEGPSTSSTKHITLQSEKVSIRNMGKKGNVASDCSFKTPSPDVFGLGDIVQDINATISQLDSVTIKMEVFNKNPYTWDNTSKTVTSKIASLNLNSNKHLQMSNLTEDVGIVISRDPSQFPEMSRAFYMKPDAPDPNYNGKSYLKYHCFNRTSRWTSMNFEIFPEDVSLNLKVYLKTGGKPDLKTGDFNLQYELPDFSSCNVDSEEHNVTQDNETIVIDPFNHCALHPYSVFVSNVDFNQTGEHCFAVQFKNGTGNNDGDGPVNSRRKRSFSCDIGKRRMRRSCVIIPPPPPKPPTASPIKVLVADNLGFDGKYFFPNQTPNYNMTMFESSCLYWDVENQTWAGQGCRVGPLTSRNNIQCFCNHLTSFGSDLVVAPNPIDFSSVFNNFGSLQDNVAVLALISTVLGLYILGVLWGRRADERDKLMIGPTILYNPQGTYHYLITLYTGNRQYSGTSAKVFFKMAGDKDETVPVKLWDAKRPCFERGQENSFLVSYPQQVGELSYVQIWHNNAGLSPSWYLSRLTVKDIQTNQKWYFVCDNWLAVESDDGKVCRVIPVANDQELTNFNQLFTARTVKGLADGHLWFSIFSRPPNSNFTRVQRLSCCLCLLCCTMITSAMFYNMGGDGPSPFAIRIGSLVIDLKQFVIALQSSLIIVPVNVAIVQIFRNLRPKPSKGEMYNEKESETKESDESKPKGKLPYWCIYIAYGLCYLASAASIFFTLLYSIQWGKVKSTEWVIAMVTAFLQSVLLLQPVKVLVLAVIFALFVRKPSDDAEQDETPVTYDPSSSSVLTAKRRKKTSKKMKIYRPPDPETLHEARVKRLKEIQMNKILKEILAFFIFLIMLMNVAYYHRDPNTFLMTKTLYETFDEVDAYSIDLGAVSEGDSLWMWARETLVPGLYATEWYNGKKAQKGFIANMEDYLVGVPRIRLVRVEEDSCTVPMLFKDSIPHCYSAFSLIDEEDRTFDVSWEPLHQESTRKRRDIQIPETEEEWLERMAEARDDTKPGNTLPDVTLPEVTLPRIKLPGVKLPGDILPWETQLGRENALGSSKRANGEKYRQKRAVDPITSSITGKNRRKKKRLLGSAKPKVYSIRGEALLPNGKILSCLERWRHQSTLDLRGFPYWGAISLYSGSGYAANLGYDAVTAYTVISDLHSNGWIDVQARAAFIEFTVYNANTNLFGIISIFVEFPSSSGAFTNVQYQAARFYLHLNSAQTLSHVLVIFFMLYFLYTEGKLVYKQRWAYFKGFWNWVETILVVSEFLTIVLFLARLYEVDRNLLQLRENPNDYVPFQYAATADAALCYILGILVFFYTLRFLRLLRFNKNFAVLGKTLSRISGPVSSFCLPFFFAFLAFGLFAFSVFSTELTDYSTFTRTMVTQFSMTLGDFDFEALVMTNPLLGPLYFFGFIALNIFILMNVFLAIINDSYAEVQEEEQETKNEYEILEYILKSMQTRMKGEPKKRKKRKKPRPKKVKEPITKPHYVTFRESEKRLEETYSSEVVNFQDSFEAINLHETSPFSEKQTSSVLSDSCESYSAPFSPNFLRGENVSKLDNCGEQLECLLERLQHAEHNETGTTEAIADISEEKRADACFRVMILMELAE